MQIQFQDNQALRYNAFGPPREVLALQSLTPIPRPSQALRVRMTYAPINPSDIIPITGAYSHLIVTPQVAGYEGVGTVVSAPPNMAHMIGKRVLPLRGSGTWQRYVDCDPELAVPVPDDIPDRLAARAYINPLSAFHMLRRWPVRGKNVVFTAASSSIAALLSQWAHADGAASVSGIYRSHHRRSWVESIGFRPIAENNTIEIERCASQADLIFDAVGGALGTGLLRGMRLGTEFVSYGLLSGQQIIPSPQGLASHRRFHLRDVLSDLEPAAWRENFRMIWPRLGTARIQDTEIFPLEHWQDALDAFDTPGRSEKPLFEL